LIDFLIVFENCFSAAKDVLFVYLLCREVSAPWLTFVADSFLSGRSELTIALITMKNSLFMLLIALIFFSFSGVEYVSAQCPSTVPDFPSIPWSSGGCKNYFINECEIEVCYCFRVITVSGVDVRFDYLVTSIDLLGDDDCVWQYVSSWEDLIFKAGEKLILDDPEDFAPCPPCPSRDFRYTFFAQNCWKYVKAGPNESVPVGNILKLQAADGSAGSCGESYCLQGYGVCCNPTTGIPEILINGSRVQFGEVECDDVPSNGYISTNTCYQFNSCSDD
jgi:hypothetical protein